jgi:hypothetical protein
MGTPSIGEHRIAYDTNDNPLYEGWAKRKNAATSSAVWKMKKYIWVSGSTSYVCTQEQWADGNELYDNIWDNRATTVSYT